MLARTSKEHHEEIRHVLQQVSLLNSLDETQISKVAGAVQVKMYKEGQTIISKGEKGHEFFMIKSGECAVVDRAYGQDVILTAGRFFGERGLLIDEPRNASIVANIARNESAAA